jgi:hypothetical protein
MSKNILIYLFGAWTASSIWMAVTGIGYNSNQAPTVTFGLFSLVAWAGTIIGLILETKKTLDNEDK